MKVIIGCEFSGIVTQAFRDKGHDAYSCDLLETEGNKDYHYIDDIRYVLRFGWDMAIFFPPCTYIANSGARWNVNRREKQLKALYFVSVLLNAPVKKIALENPIGKISTAIRKPDQIIQPWQYGHGETKATCLWLKNLPLLKPENIVEGREQRIWKMAPGPDRAKERGRTYQGIANAMANQWG